MYKFERLLLEAILFPLAEGFILLGTGIEKLGDFFFRMSAKLAPWKAQKEKEARLYSTNAAAIARGSKGLGRRPMDG